MAQENVAATLAGFDFSTIATDVEKATELVSGVIEFAEKYGSAFIPQSYLDTLNEIDSFLQGLDAVLKKV